MHDVLCPLDRLLERVLTEFLEFLLSDFSKQLVRPFPADDHPRVDICRLPFQQRRGGLRLTDQGIKLVLYFQVEPPFLVFLLQEVLLELLFPIPVLTEIGGHIDCMEFDCFHFH